MTSATPQPDSPRLSSEIVSSKPETPTLKDEPVGEYDDAEKNYQPGSPKFWIILLGMYLSLFLVALDRTIIATAIPPITNEFKSINDIGWYGSAYMLAAACMFPVSGRIYQLYSTKWSYVISIIFFEAGSALCGAAPNSPAFIVGRAIAGAGSAGIFSGSFMILQPLVPLRKRPTYSAFFGLAFGVSSVLGPVLGGLLTDHVTWRWCFYLNLPIGGFTLLGIILFFNFDESVPTKPRGIFNQLKQLDPIGVFFFVPSMVCLVLALQWGGTTDSWSSPRVIGLLVTFVVLLIVFIVVEIMTPETAMTPMRVVLNRSMAACMWYMFLLSASMMSIIYYITIWFQTAKGDSPTDAGVKTIPIVLSMVVMIIISAKATEAIGYYVPAMFVAPVLCSIGAGLLSTLSPTSGQSKWIGYQCLYGFGIGSGFQVAPLAAQTVLPRADVSIGVALIFFMQQLGGAVFLAVSQNIFAGELVKKLAGVADLDTEVILHTGATELHTVVPSDHYETVIDAYSYSLTRVFIMAAALCAFMIIGSVTAEWKSIKGDKGASKAATGDEQLEKGDGN